MQASPTVGVYTMGMISSTFDDNTLQKSFSFLSSKCMRQTYLSRSLSNRFKLANTICSCRSIVSTWAGNKPRMPSCFRSSLVNAKPLFKRLFIIACTFFKFLTRWLLTDIFYEMSLLQTYSIIHIFKSSHNIIKFIYIYIYLLMHSFYRPLLTRNI